MSRRLKLPHCRKFPPRISQEELKARTTEVMKEKGANYHFQAEFYEATSQEVVGSRNPKFCTLQPKMVHHDEDHWAEAYEFVYHFLREHKMDLTLETMEKEFDRKTKPELIGTFDKEDRNRFFAELLGTAENMKEKSFQDRVEDFAVTEGLPLNE